MPDHPPSAADADAADAAAQHDDSTGIAARPPRTPTTPSSPFSGSFSTRSSPGARSLSRSFNLHALGFNTSPLSSLGVRILHYEAASSDEEQDAREVQLGHLEEDFSNDGSLGGWRTSEDGDDDGGDGDSNGYGLDDPMALEDRKDVLIDRLNDLVRHVTSYAPSSPSLSNRSASTWNSPGKSASAAGASGDNPAEGGTVLTALHAHIDKMEAVLAAAQAAEAAALAASPQVHRHHRHHSHPKHFLWPRLEPRPANEPGAAHARRITLDAAPILFRNQSAPLPESGLLTPRTGDQTKPATVSSATVAQHCDALAGDLSAVLENLWKRREESELIQAALLQKLEAASRRTAELEAQVRALTDAKDSTTADGDAGGDSSFATETATEKDDEGDSTVADKSLVEAGERLADLDDVGSELSFLRLQLRGIEARCQSYIPADADPELAESIENWKADWSALRAKVNEERRSAQQA